MSWVTVAKLVKPTFENVRYIRDNLREIDRDEISSGLGPDYIDRNMINIVLSAKDFAWVAVLDDGTPVGVIGANMARPNVANVFAFGTNDWNRVVRLITKHILGYMIPEIIKSNIHRTECYALKDREDIRKWMTILGGRPSEPLEQWGADGRDFVIYSWLTDEVIRKSSSPRSSRRKQALENEKCA